jgi:rhodanese-related sulfurtransferase
MWRTVQRSLVIVVASAALGLAVNAVSPRRIPYITPPKLVIADSEFIPLSDAYQAWGAGSAIFLDARAPADYQAGHIANALSLPAEVFDEHWSQVAPFLAPDSAIVCYCDGVECDLSHRLTEKLREHGFKNIHVLKNAWTEWSKAGYPTTTGPQP